MNQKSSNECEIGDLTRLLAGLPRLLSSKQLAIHE
jgi:hypothetical protein